MTPNFSDNPTAQPLSREAGGQHMAQPKLEDYYM